MFGKLLSTGFLAVFLAGCATTYQPNSFTGGYSETRLAENIFSVSFRGNGYTGRDRAVDFALLRSAEVVLENGFSHFAVIDGSTVTDVSVHTMPTTTQTNFSANRVGHSMYGQATSTTYGGQSFHIRRPSTTMTIFAFPERPDGVAVVYDAEFVANGIRQKYRITRQ